jgi:hypothetical protein
MAGRLLPDQGDVKETVAAKFKFLKAMFTSRETAIKNGLTGKDRPRYVESAAEFILQTLGSKQEGAEAAAARKKLGLEKPAPEQTEMFTSAQMGDTQRSQ